MTTRIAFDFKRKQVRQIVIDDNGRKHVCSHSAKHINRFTWFEIWSAWSKRRYVLTMRTEHVMTLRYMGAKSQMEAAA